ncbi:MAG: site-specific DNA-methyltransferase [Oculatellaceae cyanobacterium bins.114]|nr:site-specific DNA-methyltransferase [Oculatellaceae cyanobacterium bins.114]
MNRTLELTEGDRDRLRQRLLKVPSEGYFSEFPTGTMQGDSTQLAKQLPLKSVDLLLLDPPYNLSKDFDGYKFAKRKVDEYSVWLEAVVTTFKPLLTDTASIYICGDWLTSASIFAVASSHFTVRNRITWEREKGRGAKSNWKNSSEDIWFCTVSDHYTFNLEAVKLRRKVLAPYRNTDGTPKDWDTTASGNFRDTHPSNIWTDITVPFWSMPENTLHPTQKSEKLIAKLVLASTNPNDRVLDPYLGSGTSSVVCKKLGRQYLGIDLSEEYCLLAERRLELAEITPEIQGFSKGVFWERNTLSVQHKV